MPESGVAGRGRPQGLIAAAAVFYGTGAVLACACRIFWPDRLGFRLLPGTLPDCVAGVVAGVVTGAVIIAASQAMIAWTEAGRRLASMQARAIAGISMPEALILALAASLVEEMIFRGVLWTLAASLFGAWAALGVTSLLFGAVHGAFRRGFLLWSATATVAGLLAGLLLIWTGALLAPIVMHLVVDAVEMPLLKRMIRTSGAR